MKALGEWKKPRKVLFLRKVGATLKDSIFEDVKQCLITYGVFDYCKVNMTDYRIKLPNLRFSWAVKQQATPVGPFGFTGFTIWEVMGTSMDKAK